MHMKKAILRVLLLCLLSGGAALSDETASASLVGEALVLTLPDRYVKITESRAINLSLGDASTFVIAGERGRYVKITESRAVGRGDPHTSALSLHLPWELEVERALASTAEVAEAGRWTPPGR